MQLTELIKESGIEMFVVVKSGSKYIHHYFNGDIKNFVHKLINTPKTFSMTVILQQIHEELFCNYTEFGVTYFIDGGCHSTLMMCVDKYNRIINNIKNEAV